MKPSKYYLYFVYDKPIPYKDLNIYPVLMDKYYEFHYCANCLLVDKNSVPDAKVISMSYLDYLYYAQDEENMWMLMLDGILKTCLRLDENEPILYGVDTKTNKSVFQIKDTIYTSEDFDEIRSIIIEQNLLEPPDENIQKEIRDNMKKAQEIKARLNKVKMGSLEDQMVAVMISTSLKLEDIYQLSIRKFSKILQRVDFKLHYQIYLSASMSGMVEFKDKSVLKHWLSDLDNDEDKYKDLLLGVDEFKNRLQFNDLKK